MGMYIVIGFSIFDTIAELVHAEHMILPHGIDYVAFRGPGATIRRLESLPSTDPGLLESLHTRKARVHYEFHQSQFLGSIQPSRERSSKAK